jgi:hypothetical protein
MMRLAVLLGLLAAAASPAAAAAPAAPSPVVSDAELSAGITLARAGDFQGALLKLDEAVRRLENAAAPDRELAQGYLYLAISYLELGQELPAVERFRAAVLRDPSLRLDRAEFSPQVIRYFDAARQEVAAMRSPGAVARPSPQAEPPVAAAKKGKRKTVLLVVAAGAAVATTVILATRGDDDQTDTPATAAAASPLGEAVTVEGGTSQLDAPGARVEVTLDGALVPPRALAMRRAAGTTRHQVEAVFTAASARPGTWRFDLPGLRPPTLQVRAGRVVALAPGAVVFRVDGRVGERLGFVFERDP